jgi:hypothetical protein
MSARVSKSELKRLRSRDERLSELEAIARGVVYAMQPLLGDSNKETPMLLPDQRDNKSVPVGADDRQNRTNGRAVQRFSWLEIVFAFLFGSLAIAAVLWVAFTSGTLSGPQFEILRIVLALAGGGVGAVIPGFLELHMRAGTRLALRAGGALAVFVVLYFWSPAHWETFSTSTVIQDTIGSPTTHKTAGVGSWGFH